VVTCLTLLALPVIVVLVLVLPFVGCALGGGTVRPLPGDRGLNLFLDCVRVTDRSDLLGTYTGTWWWWSQPTLAALELAGDGTYREAILHESATPLTNAGALERAGGGRRDRGAAGRGVAEAVRPHRAWRPPPSGPLLVTGDGAGVARPGHHRGSRTLWPVRRELTGTLGGRQADGVAAELDA
jgi:hypothetical protein